MEQGIKALIIEDDPEIRDYFSNTIELLFGEKVVVTYITSLENAEQIVLRQIATGIDLIFIDACLHSKEPNSMPLIELIISSFTGPVYAMSCNKTFIEPLLRAGCTDTCRKQKFYIAIEKYMAEKRSSS